MNASTVVSATALVACTSLFAVFYAVENSSVDVGDMYYGTISDKALGDVKFSRVGNERSLTYVDPDTQRTVLLSNDHKIEWNAEGELVSCVGASDNVVTATEAMFPGDLGGDVAIGTAPSGHVPSIPTGECYTLAMKELMQAGGAGQRKGMAEYARDLKEHDTSEMDSKDLANHKQMTAFAELALLAYEEPDSERVLHQFALHAADVYGFEIYSDTTNERGDSGSAYGRFGIFWDDTGHQTSRVAPKMYMKENSQGLRHRCVFSIRGSDDGPDWADNLTLGAAWLNGYHTGSQLLSVHTGFKDYLLRLYQAEGKSVYGSYGDQRLQGGTCSNNANTDCWSNGVVTGTEWGEEAYKCGHLGSSSSPAAWQMNSSYLYKMSLDGTAGFFVCGHSLGAGASAIMGAYSDRRARVYGYATPMMHKIQGSSSQQGFVIYGHRFYHKQDPVASNGANVAKYLIEGLGTLVLGAFIGPGLGNFVTTTLMELFQSGSTVSQRHNTRLDKERLVYRSRTSTPHRYRKCYSYRGYRVCYWRTRYTYTYHNWAYISYRTATSTKRRSIVKHNQDKGSMYEIWRYKCSTYTYTASSVNKEMTVDHSDHQVTKDCRQRHHTIQNKFEDGHTNGDIAENTSGVELTSFRKDHQKSTRDHNHMETFSWQKNNTKFSSQVPMTQAITYIDQWQGYGNDYKNNGVITNNKLQRAYFNYHDRYDDGSHLQGTTLYGIRSPFLPSCFGTGRHHNNVDSTYRSKADFDQTWNANIPNESAHFDLSINNNENWYRGYCMNCIGSSQNAFTSNTVLNGNYKRGVSYNASKNSRRTSTGYIGNKKGVWVGNHVRTVYGSDKHNQMYTKQRISNDGRGQYASDSWWRRDLCRFRKDVGINVTKSQASSSTIRLLTLDTITSHASVNLCIACHSGTEIYALEMSGASRAGVHFYANHTWSSGTSVGGQQRRLNNYAIHGFQHDNDDEYNKIQ